MYGSIANVGDVVVDDTCTFVARDIIKEMDALSDDLAEAQTDIVVLEEALLDQVDRLPPPVGTIQFSASADVDDTWLLCDGSFVSETDYPNLVAALGKHTPGVSQFTDAAGDNLTGYFSTSVIYDGRCWVYHIDTRTLHGFSLSGEETVKITVTGANALTGVVSNPVVLSICGGTVYMAQSSTATGLANFILYESAGSLDGTPTTLSMTLLDVYAAVSAYRESLSSTSYFWSMNSLPGEGFVPEVVQVQVGSATKLYVSLGVVYYNSASSRYQYSVVALHWTKGDFSTAACATYVIGYYSASGSVSEDSVRSYVFKYVKQLFRFSRKNANELFYLIANPGSSSSYRLIESASAPNALFNNSTTYSYSNVYAMLDDALETSAICYNGIYIYRAMLTNGVLTIRSGKYQSQAPFDPSAGKEQVLPLNLPSVARLFPDSVECSKSQGLWMIFVGTGIAFSRNPLDLTSWGYLDTTSVLGAITAFGGIEYDEYTNTLCITGRSSNNRLRVGLLKFEDIYSYATDGAFLPLMASDGVPAYIKALPSDTTTTE
ncbi:MAG: tail fiber protein [Oscillospiraceae bacterium]|nr:tail fiber protein [Oscillospiraceae bacterium]